ncbi:MAG: ATP-binding protein, partial [Gammaproteobacteria bacterium]|nr:ATP-binding protein [Gammaproteobacteria bacterium]
DKIDKSVADIKMAGQRGAKLVGQLLSYSRQQPNQATAHNINHIIKKLDNLIARSVTPEIEVKMLFSENLWLTEIDSSDFEEVVLNLVVNARDAMASHGVLTLETSNCVLDEVFCLAHMGYKPGEYVRLSVTDNGVGMTLEQQEHIFEPFYTTKELGKGTGLGLSMAYSFVDRSQGYIDVNSSPGKGATFNLYLPRTEDIKQHEKNDNLETVLPVRGSGTILIVDDEPALVLLSKEILSSHGYKVLMAYSGSEALDIIKNENNVDLLFSDVLMPGGMNGYELAEQALALRPDLKILFSSGYDGDNYMKEKKNLQAFTLIKKPYSSNNLLSEVLTLFESQ